MKRVSLSVVSLVVATLLVVEGTAARKKQVPAERGSLTERYRETAGRLMGAALVSDVGYERLGRLCDQFPHRLSGSVALEKAIAWCAGEMESDGLAHVHPEEVMVPTWVRGEESARILVPVEHELTILALGGSVGTPSDGLTAELVVVSSFEELESLPVTSVKGRIVLYDVAFEGYGKTVAYRTKGPSRAAALGAVAVLVRSVGPTSLDTPHTGMLSYSDDAPRIPAAAVTIENSTMLARIAERGQRIKVQLNLGAKTLADRPSANLVAELRGSEWPDEVVLLGGHIDAWDVGQGAQDDGVGCIIAWEAVRLIQESGLRPRRTLRVVLFTNEENGVRGGKAYAKEHAAELEDHVAAIESDSGNGPASGFRFQLPPLPEDLPDSESVKKQLTEEWQAKLDEIGQLLAPFSAGTMVPGGSGADVGPSVRAGVPGFGLNHDTSEYFKIHHTPADTFEKVDPDDLKRNIATMAVMAYVLADMPERLPTGRAGVSRR